MGSGCSTHSVPFSTPNQILCYSPTTLSHSTLKPNSKHFINLPTNPLNPNIPGFTNINMSSLPVLNSSKIDAFETQQEISKEPIFDPHSVDPNLLQKLLYDALVWSSLHGLVVGDRKVQKSGTIPGVGMVHAPFSLLPIAFPESHWRQACELAPIFNELFDRVSLDAKFLQHSLSRTRKVDEFTSRLLDIHSKMIDMNKTEEIRLGLHRSDYMLDAQTKSLLQIEFNTISSSFPGLSCLVSELHRNLLNHHRSHLELDFKRVPENTAVVQFAKALAEAWREYNDPRAVVLVVVQPEERNMYDQHWLCAVLRENHGIASIRKTLGEIDAEGKLLADGRTLSIGGEAVAVVYFRAGYAPTDYPSESEWGARLLIEQSSAVKCPSIGYHLAGTKKIQQKLAKSNVLERFLDNKEDIAKLRKCFAGLWSLNDSKVVSDAIERPELYVMKPQREGGGNNIYGSDVRETLQRIQKGGTEEDAAYILMQRIFPSVFPALLVREGICHKDRAISELGIYGAYLRYLCGTLQLILHRQTYSFGSAIVSGSNVWLRKYESQTQTSTAQPPPRDPNGRGWLSSNSPPLVSSPPPPQLPLPPPHHNPSPTPPPSH